MLSIIPIILGAIHTETIGTNYGYFWTEVLLTALVIAGLAITIMIYILDLKNGRTLDKPAADMKEQN